MSDYSPPSEDLPIFDVNVFLTGDEPLTYNQAKKKFLRYPNAQGTENLQTINVSGIATFNNDIIQNNDTTITQTDTTNNTTTNTLKATNIFGQLHLQKPSGANGGGLLFDDVKGLTTYNSQLYYENLITYMQNNAYNGKFQFTYKDGSGNTLYPLTLTQSSNQVRVGINTSSPNSTDTFSVIGNSSSISRTLGTSGTGIFSLNDNGGSTTRSIVFIPNTAQGNYNGIIQAGDISILGFGTSNGVNNSIVFSNWNTTPSGVRITATTSAIQFGSSEILLNSSTTTTYGTNLSLTNTNVDFTSSTPPTSSQTIPASNDSSNKIPTTAWVQSAISASPLPTNPTFNSVSISANPNPGAISTSGIANQANQGGFYGQFPYESASNLQQIFETYNGIYQTTDRQINIEFINQDTATRPSLAFAGSTQPCVVFDLDIFFYNYTGNAYGQTSCKLVIFKSALLNDWGQIGSSTQYGYNINNAINSNTSFTISDTTYAPNGRQYWTYDQKFSGQSGSTPSAYLTGKLINSNTYQIQIIPIFPNDSYNFYYSIRCLSSNSAQQTSNGVVFYS